MLKAYIVLLLQLFQCSMPASNSVVRTPRIRSVAIIGAGAAGLITADVMRKDGFDVVVFEKRSVVGGVWKFTDPTPGLQGTPMYKSLRSNLPKAIMAFGDGAAFPDSCRSYLSHQDVQSYLEDFAVTETLAPLIRFCRTVESITSVFPSSSSVSASWRVTTKSNAPLKVDPVATEGDSVQSTDYFDAVIICNGHYNAPLQPQASGMAGLKNFRGEIMHSIDYNDPGIFAGKTVLVVGSKSSGTDIAREISSVAKIVYVSDRSLIRGAGAVYGNVHHKPGILSTLSEELNNVNTGTELGNSVQFEDNSIADVDVLIWCTGYAYDYPFLPLNEDHDCVGDELSQKHSTTGLSVKIQNKRKVCNIYQQVFSISHPTLSFVGLPYSVVPFPLFLLQAKWIASIYSGRKVLPNATDQIASLKDREDELLVKHKGDLTKAIEKFHYLGDAQWDYCRLLAKSSGCDHERQLLYLKTMEEIYNDNVLMRPPYPGAPDTFRNSEYFIDYETMEWKKR